MKTEDLIARLASEAAPITPLAPTGRRLVPWLAASVVALGAGVALVGPRADLAERLADGWYLAVLVLLAFAAVSAAAVALAMSVPNDRRRRWTTALPVASGIGWALVIAAGLAAGGSLLGQLAAEPFHITCLLKIVGVGAVPALMLLGMVRAGVALDAASAGVLALGAAVSVGAMGAAVLCPIDRAAHQLLWHFLPVVGLAATGALIGRAALDRFAR